MALYLVATPIGNLEDITLRALRVLREARLIAAEDTRTTRKLLNHYGIKTPLLSYFQHSGLARLEQVLEAAGEGDVALVSEAGMPGLSDPGYEIVAAALERGIRVIPVPGPTAPVAALAASGLPSDRFLYLGFLPRRAAQRRRLLASVAGEPYTLVAFEAPHRLLASLADMARLLGERRMAVARELTKLHEEVYRGTIQGALQHFAQPRGEFTLVVEGCREAPAPVGEKEVREALVRALAEGLSRREAAARVAQETGWSRREVYRLDLTPGPSPQAERGTGGSRTAPTGRPRAHRLRREEAGLLGDIAPVGHGDLPGPGPGHLLLPLLDDRPLEAEGVVVAHVLHPAGGQTEAGERVEGRRVESREVAVANRRIRVQEGQAVPDYLLKR